MIELIKYRNSRIWHKIPKRISSPALLVQLELKVEPVMLGLLRATFPQNSQKILVDMHLLNLDFYLCIVKPMKMEDLHAFMFRKYI
uniref:Uncharacterized protein n=1 Tax=Anguilla anguilla TaxID=7936 RepID=A0A0E9RP57_ANGAN